MSALPPPLDDSEAAALADPDRAARTELARRARSIRDACWGRTLTYSPKVFLPLTNLCRNRCDYCAFRRSAGDDGEHTMTPEEVVGRLGAAREVGCVEALLCLGDQPESAFPQYRAQLDAWGHGSTVDYLVWASERALELGLLPHTNAGVLRSAEMALLARVNVSLGLMLESVSARLCEPGMPHRRAPDKRPERRLGMLREAGELAIPFTTGLLVGFGETARERVDTLLAIREVHRRFGHVQEVIVQNFTPHAGTPMAHAPAPPQDVLTHAIALARTILDPEISVQSPPNLNAGRTAALVAAGINDFGGISPVTPDYINPGRPWPRIVELAAQCKAHGHQLRPRLPIYERYVTQPGFLHPELVNAAAQARARLETRSPATGEPPRSTLGASA